MKLMVDVKNPWALTNLGAFDAFAAHGSEGHFTGLAGPNAPSNTVRETASSAEANRMTRGILICRSSEFKLVGYRFGQSFRAVETPTSAWRSQEKVIR